MTASTDLRKDTASFLRLAITVQVECELVKSSGKYQEVFLFGGGAVTTITLQVLPRATATKDRVCVCVCICGRGDGLGSLLKGN